MHQHIYSAIFQNGWRMGRGKTVAALLVAAMAVGGNALAAGGRMKSDDDVLNPDSVEGSSDSSSSSSSAMPLSGNSTAAELRPLAKGGNADAQNRLALLYMTGKGVAKDFNEGIKWMRSAADKGYAVAQLNLGLLYQAGIGVPKDPGEAAKWYRLSADQGNAGAENGIGFLYEHGLGVAQNYAEAINWYRKAIDHHNDTAQFNLAQMYDRGEGVTKDPVEAAKQLQILALRGFALAQVELGGHLLAGNGVQRDASRAYFWASLGSAHIKGNQSAIAIIIRDNAARQIGPGEVTRVQGLAAQWKSGMDEVALLKSSPSLSTASATAPPLGAMPGTGRLTGTGFLVTKTGTVLTNAHVVPACKTVSVHTSDGATHGASLLNHDERNDLALVKIDGSFTFPQIAAFRDDRGIRPGDSIISYGYPLAGILTSQGNVTTGTVSALAGLADDTRMIQITAPVQPGNSGGPVVDTSGNVVGIAVAKLNAVALARVTGDVAQNVNFAIKASVARDFLDANNVAYATAKSGHAMETADLADRMKAYTVQVLCDR